jgi:hypothetical protein
MLVRFQVHAPPAKSHAFHAETKALLSSCLERQFNFAPGPYNPLPREPVGRVGA